MDSTNLYKGKEEGDRITEVGQGDFSLLSDQLTGWGERELVVRMPGRWNEGNRTRERMNESQ